MLYYLESHRGIRYYQTSFYGFQTAKEPEPHIDLTQRKNVNIEMSPDKNWSKGISVGWLALVH